jgi:spermidine/putrescine transport system substrate-binding protein
MLKKLSKILSLILIIVFSVLSLAGCSNGSKATSSKDSEEKVVNLFTWANYVPDDVIKGFEKQTGIKVNYSNFSTNEEMLAKLQAVKGGQYDVVICADYIISVMSKQKDLLLQPIDKSSIPNYKNVDPIYLAKDYDKENKYSIPYSLGSEMLVYNSEKVKKPITEYKDLWDPSLKDSIVLIDDPRSVIGIALKKLGYSINETDQAKLDQAKAELKKLKANVKVFDADTPHNSLINGDTTVGLMWGSQASAALKGNSKLKIAYPTDGTIVEEDNFVVPVKAPHKKNADTFINYLLDGKVSDQVTENIEYVNTNTAAKPFFSKEYSNNKAVFIPEEDLKKAENIKDIGDAAKAFDLIWSEFKQQ